ncbi:MAG: flagellar FliJ family protein, partial [Clostridiaceae bacterium]
KDEEIVIKKQDVHKKHMDKKTLEILKNNDYNEYVKQINIKEQKELDEFGLFAFARKVERG